MVSLVKRAEEHSSLVKNLKKIEMGLKKTSLLPMSTIQAKPTSQNARKSNPNRIFT